MAYLGNDLQVAFPSYRNIDDISGSFNGVTTSFPLTVDGVAPIPAPINSQQCLISVNGVVQRPDDSGTEGFRLSGGNIIFAAAPAGGVDFFGVILAGADYVNVGANFPSGTAVAPSITFDSDLDTGIYNPAGNQIGFTAGGVQRLVINSSGQISSGLGTAAAPAFSFISDPNTGIYSPGADQVAISTNSTGRLFVDASGNVGVGAISTASFQSASSTVLSLRDTASSNIASLKVIGGAGAGAIAEYGATNGIGFCGTSGAHAFTFYTNSAERLRITSDGKLGLGTSSVSNKLEVYSNTDNSAVAPNSDVSGLTITNASTATDAYTGLLFRSYGGTDSVYLRAIAKANNQIDFEIGGQTSGQTSASPRLTIDSSGRVGVGTASPGDYYTDADNLVIYENGNSGITIASATTGNGSLLFADGTTGTSEYAGFIVYAHNDNSLQFGANAGEAFRVDSSRRLLVGTSTARTLFTGFTPTVQVETTTSATANISIVSTENTVGGANFWLGHARGANGLLNNGDELGAILFNGGDGTDLQTIGAKIAAEVDGAPGSNDLPSRLVFSTTADGASSPTERMRITSVGEVCIGTTAAHVANRNALENATTGQLSFRHSGATAGHYNIVGMTSGSAFVVADASGLTGVQLAYSGTSWSTLSDERHKTDLAPISDGLAKVGTLRAVTGRLVTDPGTKSRSFLIAQDVQAVLPQAVDTTDPDALALSYTEVIPLLVAALKESKERIEQLEAKVAALESA